jgi:hypothetical protein
LGSGSGIDSDGDNSITTSIANLSSESDDAPGTAKVVLRSQAASKNGLIVVGYLGRGADAGSTTSGVHQILTPTADAGTYDVVELSQDAKYDGGLRKLITDHVKGVGGTCPTIRVVVVGHSWGAYQARDKADWFHDEIKKAGGKPEIHLITIDGIVPSSTSYDPMTSAPQKKPKTFRNYYQTYDDDENVGLQIVGSQITGAINTKILKPQIVAWINEHPADSGHTGIDNMIATDVGLIVKGIAEGE